MLSSVVPSAGTLRSSVWRLGLFDFCSLPDTKVMVFEAGLAVLIVHIVAHGPTLIFVRGSLSGFVVGINLNVEFGNIGFWVSFIRLPSLFAQSGFE